MPLQISRNDITQIKADAIVCPTDHFLSGSGNTDLRIHQMAGEKLDEACGEIGYLESGDAILTPSFDAPNCRYIIHTCGPVYIDGTHDEDKILSSCYRRSLEIAREKELSSIAFPLIASGTFSFPKGQALKIASDTITDFLLDNEMDVFLLVYDKESFDTANQLYADIRDYLKENLHPRYDSGSVGSGVPREAHKRKSSKNKEVFKEEKLMSMSIPDMDMSYSFEPDESFSECLIRMIDERNMKDPDVYKKANIDRKLFNHIINTKDYRPKKQTAVALAIGMGLDIHDTDTLLERAGFVLSRSNKFDLIIRYCIENGIYDIFRINEILFEEDQKTLGC